MGAAGRGEVVPERQGRGRLLVSFHRPPATQLHLLCERERGGGGGGGGGAGAGAGAGASDAEAAAGESNPIGARQRQRRRRRNLFTPPPPRPSPSPATVTRHAGRYPLRCSPRGPLGPLRRPPPCRGRSVPPSSSSARVFLPKRECPFVLILSRPPARPPLPAYLVYPPCVCTCTCLPAPVSAAARRRRRSPALLLVVPLGAPPPLPPPRPRTRTGSPHAATSVNSPVRALGRRVVRRLQLALRRLLRKHPRPVRAPARPQQLLRVRPRSESARSVSPPPPPPSSSSQHVFPLHVLLPSWHPPRARRTRPRSGLHPRSIVATPAPTDGRARRSTPLFPFSRPTHACALEPAPPKRGMGPARSSATRGQQREFLLD